MDTHTLPAAVEPHFRELTEDQQMWFLSEYQRRSRSEGAMMVLAIIFPLQLFFLGRWGLGILLWLTSGGLLVWWIVEWFLTPGRVRAYNEEVALGLIRHLKSAGPGAGGRDLSVA